jgi:hypothetical protein
VGARVSAGGAWPPPLGDLEPEGQVRSLSRLLSDPHLSLLGLLSPFPLILLWCTQTLPSIHTPAATSSAKSSLNTTRSESLVLQVLQSQKIRNKRTFSSALAL